jgi:hypothetical protein
VKVKVTTVKAKKKPKAVDPRRRWIPADKNKEKLRWPVVKVGFDLREKKWTKVEFVGDWVGDWAVEGKESEPVKFDESVFKTLSETPRGGRGRGGGSGWNAMTTTPRASNAMTTTPRASGTSTTTRRPCLIRDVRTLAHSTRRRVPPPP